MVPALIWPKELSSKMSLPREDIERRFATRGQAERYRDRFRYGRRRRTHKREVLALQAFMLRLGRIKSVLDVGSGPGRFTPVFAAHAEHMIQVDYSLHMLHVSREDYPLADTRAGYAQADARKLPFADQSVDLVFCHRLLNHLPRAEDRRQVLTQFKRISRQHVVVSCLTPPRLLRLIRRLGDWIRGRASLDGHVEEEELLRECNEAGLRLASRVCIRRFPVLGEFLILEARSVGEW